MILNNDGEQKDHSGTGNIFDWMPNYECAPTCALVHLGTNDVCHGKTTDETLADIRRLIKALQQNSDTTVLLAVPIPGNYWCLDGSVEGYDLADLQANIPSLEDVEGKVFIVDQNSGFDPSEDTYDGIHPWARGEMKMAEKWWDAISQHCLPPSILVEGCWYSVMMDHMCISREGDGLKCVDQFTGMEAFGRMQGKSIELTWSARSSWPGLAFVGELEGNIIKFSNGLQWFRMPGATPTTVRTTSRAPTTTTVDATTSMFADIVDSPTGNETEGTTTTISTR